MAPRRACAFAALAAGLLAGDAAWADCTPAAANNVNAVCSGATLNQGAGAPGSSASVVGYGSAFVSGMTIQVLSGTTVTGTNQGILVDSGTVTNYGAVTGLGSAGVGSGGSATTYNYGTVTGINGVSGFDETVVNSGTITATNYGVNGTTAQVANSGTISGTLRGVTGGTITVTNSGTISGANEYAIRSSGPMVVNNSGAIVSANGNGIDSTGTMTISNSGAITGRLYGVYGGDMTVVNSGTITGATSNGFSINVNGLGNVTNTGTLQGGILGNNVTLNNSGAVLGNSSGGFKTAINVGTANVVNSGAISGINYGINAGSGSVTNTGTVSGNIAIRYSGGTAVSLVNAGRIAGNGGTAIDLSGSNGDSLTLLQGSRVTGAIKLGSGDNVTMAAGGDISSLTTFTPNGAYTLNVTGSAPYVVSGNQVAIVDPTSFAVAERAVMDITRAISGLVEQRFEDSAASDGANAMAYATPRGVAAEFNRVFAQFPGMRARQSDSSYGVWAKGFAAERIQSASAETFRAVTDYGGGVLGIDRRLAPDLRAGAFVGVGKARTGIDSDSGGSDSDLMFAGVYGRWSGGASFLDAAVSGGVSHNGMTRTIANNLALTGLETASANSSDWYISPDLSYGIRYSLGGSWILTPAAHLRYVAARLGGYTETGSSANMTVGARTAQDFEQRGDLTLARTFTLADRALVRVSLRGGVLGQQRVGATTVNAILLGQNLAFAAPGKSSVSGVYIGGGLNWRRTEQFSLFVDGEYTTMSDSSSVVIAKGGLRAAFN